MPDWPSLSPVPQPPQSPLPMAALRRLRPRSVVLRPPTVTNSVRMVSVDNDPPRAWAEAPVIRRRSPMDEAHAEVDNLIPPLLTPEPDRRVAPPPAPSAPPRPAHTRTQFLLVAALLTLAVIGFALTTRTVSFRQATTFSGVVEAASQIPVNFPTAGRIAEVRVTVGDRVKAGDVLATQDQTVAKQALAAAEAKLRADEADLARIKSPTTQRVLLELDVKRARAQLLAAQAASAAATTSTAREAARQRVAAAGLALDAARARVQEEARGGSRARRSAVEAVIEHDKAAVALAKGVLQDKVLVAPVSGVVLDIGATPGAVAESAGVRTYPNPDPVTDPSNGFSFLPSAPGAQASRPNDGNGFASLLTLGDDSRWRVKAQVPESQIVRLRTGQVVDIAFTALPRVRVPATLTTRGMAPIFVGDKVNYAAVFELQSAPDDVLPGMTATVHLR